MLDAWRNYPCNFSWFYSQNNFSWSVSFTMIITTQENIRVRRKLHGEAGLAAVWICNTTLRSLNSWDDNNLVLVGKEVWLNPTSFNDFITPFCLVISRFIWNKLLNLKLFLICTVKIRTIAYMALLINKEIKLSYKKNLLLEHSFV